MKITSACQISLGLELTNERYNFFGRRCLVAIYPSNLEYLF